MDSPTVLDFNRLESSSPSRGNIQLIFGPMFSGKTTELLRRIKRFSIARRRCLVIKYAKDTRYCENGVSTHDRQEQPAVACCKLSEVEEQAETYGVIGIDEGQFFPDVVEFSDRMANKGKVVIIAALDGTFQRKPFNDVLSLLPMAESVVKLSSVCMTCFSEAAFSKRITADTEVEKVGGAETYRAVCRTCYFKNESLTPARTESPPVLGAVDATTQRELFPEA